MKTPLFILLMFFFCCCGSKKTDNSGNEDSVIRIDLLSEPESTVTNLSDFATNVDYIALQTTENSLLWEFVLKIVYTDNKIYIKNGGMGGEIMCFDMDGKYLFKLDNRGRGPEEYTNITDFDVSFDNKILTILSTMNRKLVTYAITDTGFIFQRSLTIKDPVPWKIGLVPETDFAFLAINPWNRTASVLSLLINSNGDTINFKPNYYAGRQDKAGPAVTSTTLVYSNDLAVCFRDYFSDTVFYVDAKANSFKPRIIFDTHGTLSTPEMIGHPDRVGEHTINFYGIYETTRYVFYGYYEEGPKKFKTILYDKNVKTNYSLDIGTYNVTIANIPRDVEMIKLKDDLSGGPDFNQDILNLNSHNSGGKLFSLVDAIALKKYITSEDFKNAKGSDPKKKEALETLANSLKDTDNPVLIVVTPKE